MCERRRKLPGVIRLVRKGFGAILREVVEMWNLYAKNIMFACSLPMPTSTWRSNHHHGPGGYMSGELKLEKHKYGESPHSVTVVDAERGQV
jgi:hypothetical protein